MILKIKGITIELCKETSTKKLKQLIKLCKEVTPTSKEHKTLINWVITDTEKELQNREIEKFILTN
tara:strand:- start:678 stop:875 length:198 start_codon:yes stop_codon:yes gene_type:complete